MSRRRLSLTEPAYHGTPIEHPDDPNAYLIPSSHGMSFAIDKEDWEHAKYIRWNIIRVQKNKEREYWYAYGYLYGYRDPEGKKVQRSAYLHRYLMDCYDRKDVVDHDNGDTLDCRRKNLVRTDSTGNAANTHHHRKIRALEEEVRQLRAQLNT